MSRFAIQWSYLRAWLRGRNGIIVAAAGAAAIIVLFAVIIAHANASQQPRALVAAANSATATATATAVSTSTPTATVVPPTAVVAKPTATPVPHPLPVPSNAPPPAHNPVPPPVTPTPRPTATAVPPTPTSTPAPTDTPCASTGVCSPPTALPPTPTATPAPPTPTPGACQPGGAPYYVTPTTVPSRATIDQSITNAATRNGLPVQLQRAIAWQESGWQENIVACDGGIGLMQLMPTTVTWLNNYYHVNDDPATLDGNAGLGAGYIAFYYGYYIGYLQQNFPATCGSAGCNWTTVWPSGTDGATVQDIVISVYNEGAGTMSTYGIINWSYVKNVELWMAQSPWN